MIQVTLFRRQNRWAGFRSEGHAGYSPEGADIICAAVSVLTTNTVNAIEELTQEEFEGEQRDGYLELRLKDIPGDAAELLLQAMVLGLTSVQESYGDCYIQIDTKEV